ncbi:MAG: DUF6350 family protein [Actinomycetota bacterium]
MALTLFPLAFISLFAWAAAGSTTGNTTEPIRTSAWLFLGAHLIPFSVPTGKLSVLPLLAVVFPMWALRRGLPSVEEAFSRINGARIVYAFWYALLCELIALASRHNGVEANLYLTPIFTLIIALIATVDPHYLRNRAFYFAGYIFFVALGICSMIFAVSLYEHRETIKSISVVIAPGAVGGVLFTLIQLLYLPNIALAALSYFTGIGFSLGSHSMINGHQVTLGQVPALPITAALPTGVHKELIYGLVFWLLFFILLFLLIRLESTSVLKRTTYTFVQGVRIFIALGVIAYLSSGELFSSGLNPVGIIWWRFLAYLALAFAVASIVVLYIPALFKKAVHHG